MVIPMRHRSRIHHMGFGLAFVSVLLACSPARQASNIVSNSTYRVLFSSPPKVLDPIRSDSPTSMHVMHALNATLVRIDANGAIIPHVAKSWEILKHGTVYRFVMRDDVHFHNGRRVTMTDIVESLQRVVEPGSLYRDNFRMVDGYDALVQQREGSLRGIRRIGPNTIEFVLTQRFEPFLTMLTSPTFAILPITELRTDPNFFDHPIGAGAFRWDDSTNSRKHITLRRFDRYFLPPPHLEQVEFLVEPDVEKARAMLQGGTAEQAFLPVSTGGFAAHPQSRKVVLNEARTYVFSFDLSRPPFSIEAARQALHAALDIKRIQLALASYPNLYPCGSYIPKGLPGYEPNHQPTNYDPMTAKQLFAEVVTRHPAARSPVRFALHAPKPAEAVIVAVVREAFQTLGIPVQIDTTWASRDEDLPNNTSPQMFFMGFAPNFPDAFFLLNYFHSQSVGTISWSRLRDRSFDRLLDRAVQTVNYRERIDLYRQLNRHLVDHAIVLPVYAGSQHDGFFRRTVHGLEFPYPNLPLPQLEKVWIATK